MTITQPSAGTVERPTDDALHAVLVSGDRPARPGALTVSIAFGHRALLKIKHVPEQLFDVTAFPVMLTLMFTYLFGGALAGSVDAYIQFFLPGILVQTVAGGLLGVLAGVALLLVFAFSIGWVWTLLGLVLRTPSSVMGTSMMVLFPLTFASNIFVDPDTMPGWLQAFVEVNPVSHLVTAVRGLMQATATTGDVVTVLAWSAALVAVFGPLTMRRYSNRD